MRERECRKYINILIKVCKIQAARHCLYHLSAALNNVIAFNKCCLWRNAHRYFVHNRLSMSTSAGWRYPKCNLHTLLQFGFCAFFFSYIFRREPFFVCVVLFLPFFFTQLPFSNRFEHVNYRCLHLNV